MTSQARTASNTNERGYVLITGALCCTVLVTFLGFAVDVGYLQQQKLRAQAAADAAAAGAAAAKGLGGSSTVVTNQGQYDASLDGFTDGANNTTVTINNPPSVGYYTSKNNYVEAIVSQVEPTYFMRMMGLSAVTVKARSVAKSGSSGTACIYAMDPTAAKAVWFTGSGNDSTCGIMDNSNAANAFTSVGSECMTTSFIGVVGGNSVGSSCPTVDGSGNPVSVTTISSFSDPLAAAVPPTVAGTPVCDFTAGTYSTQTLSPGIYCGGIKSTGTNSLTFTPGTYIIFGGGLTTTGSGSWTGTGGVTFYLTAGKASNGTTYSYGGISLNGSGTYNLVAPTTGSLQGMLFFEDRSQMSQAVSAQNTINGSSSSNFTGIIYMPNQPMTWTGSTTSNAPYTIIVADTFKATGTVSFGNDFSSLQNGNPIPGNPGITFGE